MNPATAHVLVATPDISGNLRWLWKQLKTWHALSINKTLDAFMI